MDQIRCGVIGIGWFGEYHIDTLTELPLAAMSAVCTRTESRLKQIADQYSVPKQYTDYRELLADKDIDMVSVATHVSDHVQPTIDALRAGKHVFVEKPMANTVEECDRILAEAAKTDKLFMTGHICRFDTAYALAKDEIDGGNIGRVVSMRAKRNLAGFITETQLEKISALFGDGIHDLDLMLWYTGAKPKRVYAQTQNTRGKPFDDVGWAMFELDNGATAVVESNWSMPNDVPFAIDARMEVIGTDGWITVDNSGAHFQVHGKNGLKYPQATYWPKVNDRRRGYLKEEFDYFLKCIADGRKPSVITPRESRDVVHACRVAEESARQKKAIEF